MNSSGPPVMNEPVGELERILDGILDGTEIDWSAESARFPDATAPLKAMELLDHVAQCHRRILLSSTLDASRGPDDASPGDGRGAPELDSNWGRLRILERIGAGSFGEVFRAYDPGLQIDVALKLWRRSLDRRSTDQLLAEAQSLARIRHPHVLVVHGADEHDGRAGMWTDLLKGQTLEQLLTIQGPFSGGEAALIGIDLCRALAAVHSTGFLHGDVKTTNVMREQGGRIVLMDFGTAAQTQTTAGAAASLVGTPLIMSPELLGGDSASPASDLYALGVLLYRLVSARYPIEASSMEELRTHHEARSAVPLRDRRPDLSPAFVAVIERALAREPGRRFASAGVMEHALSEALREGSTPSTPILAARENGVHPASGSRRRMGVTLAVASAIVALTVGGIALTRKPHRVTSEPTQSPLRYSIQLPAGLRLSGYANVAVSPDGGSIAYAADDSTGVSRLWLRRLDAAEAIALPGTEGAFYPFWSPGSRDVAFFSRGVLKRIAVGGGPVQTVCKATAGRGGAWGRDGSILFAASTEGPLSLVRADGGTPVAATALDSTSGEVAHRWPCLLPDGTHFVYVTLPARDGAFRLYVGSLRSDRRKYIGPAESGAAFASGCLIYVANRTLLAHPFDDRAMEWRADAVPLADASRYEGSLAEIHASASQNGVLVYQALTNRENRLVWYESALRRLTPLATGPYFDPRIAPDGRRVAVERAESATESNVWILDATSGAGERWTHDPGLNRFPQWSPRGDTLLFATNRSGRYELIERAVAGATEERTLRPPPHVLLKWPSDWAPDGTISYTVYDPHTSFDVWDVRGSGASPRQHQPSNEANATVSPTGRWLAFDSDRSGNREVYCQDRASGTTFRVSATGGTQPRWCRGTGELFFLTPRGELSAARPGAGDPSSWPTRQVLRMKGILSFDVDSSGRRVIVCAETSGSHPDELSVLVNLPMAVARGL